MFLACIEVTVLIESFILKRFFKFEEILLYIFLLEYFMFLKY